MTSTGSTGGWAASAAGGSQTTAWRARNPERVAGIVALNSLPSVSGRTDPERTWAFHCATLTVARETCADSSGGYGE